MSGRGSSFYWAMRLLGRQRREAMFALYGFCREVDDIADDGAFSSEDRLARLEQWRERVRALYDGAPDHELTCALAGPVADYGLAQADLLAVVDGVAMDAQGLMRRPSQARLDLYCDRVASAVGRLAVRIFGVPEPRGGELAAVLGRALQLTNILRDLAEDGARGRLYLPDELLSAHGIESDDPPAVLNHPALPLVCRDLARMADNFYAHSWRIMAEGPRGPMRPSYLMASHYQALLVRMDQCGWSKGQERVSLPVFYKLWLVICSIRGWGLGWKRRQTDLPK